MNEINVKSKNQSGGVTAGIVQNLEQKNVIPPKKSWFSKVVSFFGGFFGAFIKKLIN